MSVPSRLQRLDWLREMQALVAVGLVGVGVFTVGRLFSVTVGGGKIPVALLARSVDGVAGARPAGGRAEISRAGVVQATVIDPDPGQALLYVLTWLPTALLTLAVLGLLYAVLRGSRRRDPFTGRSVRWLRTAAWVAIIGGEVAGIAESLAGMALSDSVVPGHTAPVSVLHVPVTWFFGGFALLVAAELIRRGSLMRDELAEVV
jgi:hypothetical protein